MTSTELMWLRGQAAQRNILHLYAYGTAFVGTAALQAIHLGVTAPRSYWAALSRAASAPPQGRITANVVPLIAPPLVVDPTPVAEPVLAPVAAAPADLPEVPADGVADDLTALKGVGAKLAQALNDLGLTRFDQIAALDEAAIARIDARQKGFRMTCTRHDIVAQARARL
jgi:predicted flap endonuclease-1-like 5' DNA nuclease